MTQPTVNTLPRTIGFDLGSKRSFYCILGIDVAHRTTQVHGRTHLGGAVLIERHSESPAPHAREHRVIVAEQGVVEDVAAARGSRWSPPRADSDKARSRFPRAIHRRRAGWRNGRRRTRHSSSHVRASRRTGSGSEPAARSLGEL